MKGEVELGIQILLTILEHETQILLATLMIEGQTQQGRQEEKLESVQSVLRTDGKGIQIGTIHFEKTIITNISHHITTLTMTKDVEPIE